MKIEQYQQEILRTVNPDLDKKERIKNNCFGIGGEAGEVLDLFKKYFFQGHSIDLEKVKEEIGDLMWYIGNLLNEYHISFKEVMEMNIQKLFNRYTNGFNKDCSKNRKIIKELELEYVDMAYELEEDVKKILEADND